MSPGLRPSDIIPSSSFPPAPGLLNYRMSSITFVTSFFYIYDSEYDATKTTLWRIDRFRELVALGIKLCVYISPEMEQFVRPIADENPETIKIMRILRHDETIIAKMLEEYPDYKLPSNRNEGKDKAEYHIVINSKTEFMSDAVQQNPWNTTHFAWIDFNITHVFSNKNYTLPFVQWMATQTYIKPQCFVIAGCGPWSAYNNVDIASITESVYWRFCGGFLLADAESILRFHQLYLEYFPKFLREYRTLVWEVNFWSWLETNSDWQITWFAADHNDSIVCNIPAEFFTPALASLDTAVYNYPCIGDNDDMELQNDAIATHDHTEFTMMQKINEGKGVAPYFPSSASYLETSDGRHLLNTRYVNYWYKDNGQYMFFRNNPNYIHNLNICSILDPPLMLPKKYIKMAETIDLPLYEYYSRGIEDLRLYEYRNKIRYIATSVCYYHTQGNRMVVGDYEVGDSEGHYTNSRIVESPEGNYLEKNWAPLIVNNPASPFHDRELFVYKWSPFTIGELRENPDGQTCELDIVAKFDISRAPFFHKMKGSTQFLDTGEVLLGVAHFTEDSSPRKYFHMLVSLDRTTMQPLQYSNPFCFEKVSIEFCIGFRISDGGSKYTFWISRMDRDPLMIRVDADKIPLCGKF